MKAKLWHMADALRNNMDAAEHKHIGLIFYGRIGNSTQSMNPKELTEYISKR